MWPRGGGVVTLTMRKDYIALPRVKRLASPRRAVEWIGLASHERTCPKGWTRLRAVGELGDLFAGRLGWASEPWSVATASGASEGIKNDVVERRERNGRKAGANGDELMTSEVGP